MCGEDGRTYGSACAAACAHVTVARRGECSGGGDATDQDPPVDECSRCSHAPNSPVRACAAVACRAATGSQGVAESRQHSIVGSFMTHEEPAPERLLRCGCWMVTVWRAYWAHYRRPYRAQPFAQLLTRADTTFNCWHWRGPCVRARAGVRRRRRHIRYRVRRTLQRHRCGLHRPVR